MINGKTIGVVTRFKDRLSFISQALPTWCAIPEIDEIVIVDWSSGEDVIPLVDYIDDPRISVIRIPNQRYFDSGRSWNVGIRHLSTYYVCAVDCDIIMKNNFLDAIKPLPNNFFYRTSAEKKGLIGTGIFTKEMWEDLNGYVEGFRMYGSEDIHFYDTACKRGYIEKKLLSNMTHIGHSTVLRTKHFENPVLSGTRNIADLKRGRLRKYKHTLTEGKIYRNGSWSHPGWF